MFKCDSDYYILLIYRIIEEISKDDGVRELTMMMTFTENFVSRFVSDFCSITYAVYINLHLLSADKIDDDQFFFFVLLVHNTSLSPE